MRKLIVVGVLAAVAIAVLAVPAFASFDRHFSVISKDVSFHSTQHGFVFTEKLLDRRNRQDRVGRDRVKCRDTDFPIRCHAVVHLNGKIGGFGDIRLIGDIERGEPNRFNVIGGTADFNGVAGKMLVRYLTATADRLRFDLVR